MGEVIVYRLNNVMEFIMFCLVVSSIIGFLFFHLTKEEKIVKNQVKIYGLLMNLSKIEIIMLCVSFVRMLAIIYCAITSGKDVFEYSAVILILSMIFTLYNLKKIITETVNSISPCIAIYLINILFNYQKDVETNKYVSIIKITLIIFVCLYSIYVFLSNLEDIVNKNIRRNAHEKK